MSFKTNNNQQLTLDDRFNRLTHREQRFVLKSWAKDFADIVFPAISEERFSVLYSDQEFSRPASPINVKVGAFMLKEMLHLSDDELLASICCDVRFQYALHTTSFNEQPISDRTFSLFRARLYEYELSTGIDLLKEEMMQLADVYAKYLNLHSNIKRMDSLMIASNSKRMSRLEIIYTVNANAVKLLHRLGADDRIPKELEHYLNADDLNDVIYYCKGEDISTRLEKAIKEADQLKQIMSGEEWQEFQEYQLLTRVLNEQAQADGEGTLKVKSKNEITPDSLQNPSDPDATFRKKAGKDYKGYVGNIIETVGDDGISLITGVGYENNTHSDSSFCKEYMNTRSEDSPAEILITDGAYSGTENSALAEEKNVELVTTSLTGKLPETIIGEFQLSEDGREVVSCPIGNKPIKTSYYETTGMCRAVFAKDCCQYCQHRDKCNVKIQNKTVFINVSAKMIERAKYLVKTSSMEYIKLTRMRNGVEGIPSVLRRKYQIDKIPVRGYLKSKMFFMCKAGAYNIRKLIKHLPKAREKSTQNLVIV